MLKHNQSGKEKKMEQEQKRLKLIIPMFLHQIHVTNNNKKIYQKLGRKH